MSMASLEFHCDGEGFEVVEAKPKREPKRTKQMKKRIFFVLDYCLSGRYVEGTSYKIQDM
jgi:hypothetical protein